MNIWQKRIPTILGLLFLILSIAGGVFLVQTGGIWFLRAGPEVVPQQIKITNISENSFTVSWITEQAVLGFIKYGITPSLEETVVDERDKLSGQTTAYLTHHVKVEGLKPASKYYFRIGSGKRLFDNNGKPYQVTTASVLETPPPADTVYGTILQADGSEAAGVIVYLTLANSTPLSSLTGATGNWAIPLSMARTKDLSSYISYDPEASVEEIFVQGGKQGTATAVVTTKNDSPVPAITLGKSYDFRETKATLSPTPIPSPATATALSPKPSPSPTPTLSPSKFSLQPISTPAVVEEKELEITNPQEGEKVNTQKPAIIGTGPAGQSLTITIQSPATQSAQVTIDEKGDWQWSPPDNLEPGEHTVTISYLDDKGNEQKLTRNFTILAGGEEIPAIEASPSAEATPTAAPRKAMPSTEEGVPEPGYLTPTIIFVILGIILVCTGLFLNWGFYG